ncbi:MAG: macro domain-containing protein [Deltaproteobacteria bacterium]|nr:macro domain-containing protein [Deltaproteobacteria bacterium]
MTEKKVNGRTIRLMRDDITLLDVEAFVFYASPDLQLGSGWGNAIAVRGGPAIQDELKPFGTVEAGRAVVTGGGNLKAKFIVHAVGPRFQEKDVEGKLRTTVRNALKAAEDKGVRRLAFPPMGTGFYGVPLDVSAKVTLGVIREHLAGATKLEEVILCAKDTREIGPFKAVLDSSA